MPPILRKIFLYGISREQLLEDRSRIIVMNSISISTIIILLIASAIFAAIGYYSILKSWIVFPLLVSIIFLNKNRKFSYAKILFTYGALMLVFALAIFDRRTGIEFLMLTIACSSAFAFKSTSSVLIAFSISTLIFAAFVTIDHNIPFEPDPTVNYSLVSTGMAIIAGSIVFIEMIVFRNLIHRYSHSLDYANRQLQQANEELNSINESLDAVVKERTHEVELRGQRLNELVEELNAKNEKLNFSIEALRQRNFEMDQLVYQLSHRLKAPLCSIAGLNNLMQIDPTPELIQTALPKVDKKIQEMDNVFKSVASMTTFNNQKPESEEVNVFDLVKDVAQKLNKIRGGNRVKISIAPFEANLVTDGKMLRVAIHQVIKNAIMFRHDRRDSTLHISGNQHGNSLNLEFRDNGIGIAPHVQSKVFDMFSKISDQSSGAGLGLYVTREILKKLGGTIMLHSDEEGTCVAFSLPYKPAQEFVSVRRQSI